MPREKKPADAATIDANDIFTNGGTEAPPADAANVPALEAGDTGDSQPAATEAAEARADEVPFEDLDGVSAVPQGAPTSFFMDLSQDVTWKPITRGAKLLVSVTAADAKISGAGNGYIATKLRVERVLDAAGAPEDEFAFWRNRVIRDNFTFTPPNKDTGSRGSIGITRRKFEALNVEWNAIAFKTQAVFMSWLADRAEAMIGAVCFVEAGIDYDPTKIDNATGEPYPPKNTANYYAPYKPAAPVVKDEDLPF